MFQNIGMSHVVVLSYNNVGNFGDRLGYHLLNHILPPHVQVTYAHFKPWNVPDTPIDLFVLCIGNSLFQPLITDDLINVLERSTHAIGIFGTQYRSVLDKNRINMVLDRLDMWYARYQEDIDCYARSRSNVIHFGDWLINAFPMRQANDGNLLKIGDEVLKNLPLDRIIQQIQTYRRVFSKRLHPLLCALTSADVAAYTEQREDGTGKESGKFRSMFLDIFGKVYPENTYFEIDKEKVLTYKSKVHANVNRLQEDLIQYLPIKRKS